MLTQHARTEEWICSYCLAIVPPAYNHKCLEYDKANARAGTRPEQQNTDINAVERALDLIDELYRKYGVELDAGDVAIAQAARNSLLTTQVTDAMVARGRAELPADASPGAKEREIDLVRRIYLAMLTTSPRQTEGLVEALTPSAATKAAYHGEFTFEVGDGESDAGIERFRKVYVPWTTVKEIMAAIRNRALLNPGGEP